MGGAVTRNPASPLAALILAPRRRAHAPCGRWLRAASMDWSGMLDAPAASPLTSARPTGGSGGATTGFGAAVCGGSGGGGGVGADCKDVAGPLVVGIAAPAEADRGGGGSGGGGDRVLGTAIGVRGDSQPGSSGGGGADGSMPGAGALWSCTFCGVDCGAAAAPLAFDISLELVSAAGAPSSKHT